MIRTIDAIESLIPNAEYEFDPIENKILKWYSKEKQPSEEAIQAKLKELQADYDSKQYQRDRADAYDPIPEQLDQIYHDMDGWRAKIKAVKDKYPRPK